MLAGLKGLNGQLEFFSVDDMETMAAAEHFMATDVDWDPTGGRPIICGCCGGLLGVGGQGTESSWTDAPLVGCHECCCVLLGTGGDGKEMSWTEAQPPVRSRGATITTTTPTGGCHGCCGGLLGHTAE